MHRRPGIFIKDLLCNCSCNLTEVHKDMPMLLPKLFTYKATHSTYELDLSVSNSYPVWLSFVYVPAPSNSKMEKYIYINKSGRLLQTCFHSQESRGHLSLTNPHSYVSHFFPFSSKLA